MTPEHSKIINTVAGRILKPKGIVRKGQSRSWLDDHGWFTTLIEFQPHSWDKGTFLNVGVNFHWFEQDYWSFDIGSRESEFIKFTSADQFTHETEKLAQLALEKMLSYRDALHDIHTARTLILNHTFTSESLWGNYHKAIVCGLTKDIEGLNKHFDALLAVDHEFEWVDALKNCVKKLKEIASDFTAFRKEIEEIIMRTRMAKRLPVIGVAFAGSFLSQ